MLIFSYCLFILIGIPSSLTAGAHTDLAALSLELNVLYESIKPHFDNTLTRAFTEVRRRYDTYLREKEISSGFQKLMDLTASFAALSKKTGGFYEELLKEYNSIQKDPDDTLKETLFASPQSFATWHQTEEQYQTQKINLKRLESIFVDERYGRISNITTKNVLESLLKTLEEYGEIVTRYQNTLDTYTTWTHVKMIQFKPTYQKLTAWAQEKRKEIETQLPLTSESTLQKAGARTLSMTKQELCKLPPETFITILDTPLALDQPQFIKHVNEKGTLSNITKISVNYEYKDAQLVKREKPFIIDARLPGAPISLYNWLKELPATACKKQKTISADI